MVAKGNPQNFSFQKKLRNFETLIFCQDSARIRIRIRSGSVIIGNGYADPDPDPDQNETDPQHCFKLQILTEIERNRVYRVPHNLTILSIPIFNFISFPISFLLWLCGILSRGRVVPFQGPFPFCRIVFRLLILAIFYQIKSSLLYIFFFPSSLP